MLSDLQVMYRLTPYGHGWETHGKAKQTFIRWVIKNMCKCMIHLYKKKKKHKKNGPDLNQHVQANKQWTTSAFTDREHTYIYTHSKYTLTYSRRGWSVCRRSLTIVHYLKQLINQKGSCAAGLCCHNTMGAGEGDREGNNFCGNPWILKRVSTDA